MIGKSMILCALAIYLLVVLAVEAKSADKINDYLERNRPDDMSLSSNLVAGRDYLTEEVTKGSRSFFRNNDQLIQDLNTFVSLEKLENGSEKCNANSWKILSKNKKLLGIDVEAKVLAKQEPLNRLESLIWGAISKHRLDCHYVYLKKYEEAKKQLDGSANGKLIERAEAVTSILIPDRASNSARDLTQFDGEFAHKNLVRVLEEQASGNVDHQGDSSFVNADGSFNSEKYRNLYEQYMHKPCVFFVKNLEADIFEPAIFDFYFQKTLGIALDTYKVCKRLADDAFSKKLYQLMIQYASQGSLGSPPAYNSRAFMTML